MSTKRLQWRDYHMGTTGMGGKVAGAGLFAIWATTRLHEFIRHLDEQGQPFPFDPILREFPVATMYTMTDYINLTLMPKGLHIKPIIEAVEQPLSHKHFDRHGSEIPCQVFHYLHDRDDYGIVGQWENDSGNTKVSTIWIGDEDCRFQTRVLSTDRSWDGRTASWPTEEAAKAGHDSMIQAIQAYPPKEA